MYSDTSSALALSGPVQREVQEQLLAQVSGGLLNRVVISPPLFKLSPVFFSKSHGSRGASVTVFDWSGYKRVVLSGTLALSRSQSFPQPPTTPSL